MRKETEALLDAPFVRINYLTHIDNTRRLAYVETPKVACTSIKKFMMDQYAGGEFVLENPNKVHDREVSPLKQMNELEAAAGRSVWGPDYRRFSFVRNPFTRLLSGYLDKLVTNEFERQRHLPMMGFEQGSRPSLIQFLERLAQKPDHERDIHFMTQSALLMVEKVEYDFLGRFEEFKRDFSRLQTRYYGIPRPENSYEDFGKHHASNAGEKVREYIGSEEAELVKQIYRRDFALFDYPNTIDNVDDRPAHVVCEALRERACATSGLV